MAFLGLNAGFLVRCYSRPGHCFQCPGGDGRSADRRRGGLRLAGWMPALRVPRTAVGAVALHRAVGHGRKPRHEAAAGGPAGCDGPGAVIGWRGDQSQVAVALFKDSGCGQADQVNATTLPVSCIIYYVGLRGTGRPDDIRQR
jgi:hypothetical protein